MCRCFVKFTLFFVNFIFVLVGLLIIAAGIYVVYQLKTLTQITDQLPISVDFVPYVIIGLGAVVFLISFSGCCGSISEVKCLLITYSVCMALLAAAKIVITILLFVNLSALKNTFETAVDNLFISEDPVQNATFHILESQLKCCGTTGPESYVNDYNLTAPTCCEGGGNFTIDDLPINNLTINNLTYPKNLQRQNIPLGDLSIDDLPGNLTIGDLPIDIGNLGNLTMCTREESYEIGCTTLIGGAVKSIGKSFGIGLIIVIGFEVLTMSFAIYLIRSMNPKKDIIIEPKPRYYYY